MQSLDCMDTRVSTDPGILSEGGGGGGGPCPTARKRPEQRLFYSSINLTVYRGGQMVLLERKLYFSKDTEGVQHFSEGRRPNFFPGAGGPNANFYRNQCYL